MMIIITLHYIIREQPIRKTPADHSLSFRDYSCNVTVTPWGVSTQIPDWKNRNFVCVLILFGSSPSPSQTNPCDHKNTSMRCTYLASLLFLQRALYRLLAFLAQACANLRGKVRSAEGPPRPGDSAISKLWLTNLLRERAIIGEGSLVESVEAQGLDGNRGLAGAMTKIKVAYRHKNKSCSTQLPSPPATFILKMSRGGLEGRQNTIATGQYREALFYASPLSKALTPGLFPKVLYSHSSQLFGEYVILMEDLTSTNNNAVGVNMVFGNQIWGMAKPLDPTRDPVAVLEAMYMRAAEIHALFWNDERLLKQSWLKGAKWYSGQGRAIWELGMDRARQAWASTKSKISSGKTQVAFSPKLVSIIDESLAKASWRSLQTHLNKPGVPFTLCHGDFHAANMFLLNDKEDIELVMFDWSEVGPWEPTTDLAQTIISDVKASIFLEHSRGLVRKYWERLVELGVSSQEYPFSTCWESFCRGGPERWIWIFVVLSSFPVPDALVQYFHDQLLAFIEGHGDQPFYELKPIVCLS